MNVYEFGERCEYEGILWSNLALDSQQAFQIIKAAIIAKFELNLSLTAEALDEHDDQDYINAHLERKRDDMQKLELARQATSAQDLENIYSVFIRHRNVVETVGCDYWSLLAEQEISKKSNTSSDL